MDDISINLKLEIAIVALKTVRLNTKSKWERAVINKALDMINNPWKYDWQYLNKGTERESNENQT